MPDARRDEFRRTEGQPECVEARPLFGGSNRDATADTGAGEAKPGNSEHNLSRVAKQAALAAMAIALQVDKLVLKNSVTRN